MSLPAQAIFRYTDATARALNMSSIYINGVLDAPRAAEQAGADQ